jgi:hypothetical protein
MNFIDSLIKSGLLLWPRSDGTTFSAREIAEREAFYLSLKKPYDPETHVACTRYYIFCCNEMAHVTNVIAENKQTDLLPKLKIVSILLRMRRDFVLSTLPSLPSRDTCIELAQYVFEKYGLIPCADGTELSFSERMNCERNYNALFDDDVSDFHLQFCESEANRLSQISTSHEVDGVDLADNYALDIVARIFHSRCYMA